MRGMDRMREIFEGKRVAVIGFGVSNIPIVEMLLRYRTSSLLICDKKEELLKDIVRMTGGRARISVGEGYLEPLLKEDFDYIIPSPGVRRNMPEIEEALRKGAKIETETRLFFRFCISKRIVGITGTAGKSTTTTLTGEIMKRSRGSDVWVGGNIGNPLISAIDEIGEGSTVILELSSFQLQDMEESPGISVILNIFPNHLDLHRDMEDYIRAKERIFLYQGPEDISLFNGDDPICLALSERCRGKRAFFSMSSENMEEGAFLRSENGTKIFVRHKGLDYPICDVRESKLLGPHNIANIMAASYVSMVLGADPGMIRETIKEFKGIEHRMEFVGELDGVRFFNDSKATVPESTISALRSFDDPLILIAGGYDKGVGFDTLGEEIVSRTAGLVLIGQTAEKIREAVLRKDPDFDRKARVASELEEATLIAFEMARPLKGVVLLSPACASFDMFSNYEERGKRFKEVVVGLQRELAKESEIPR